MSTYYEYEYPTDTESNMITGAFTMTLDEGSAVSCGEETEFGATFAVTVPDGEEADKAVAVKLSWEALQILADELNNTLRQARINGWRTQAQ
jgi:hypothetical protein